LLFVIDAQLPPSLAGALRAAGYDAVHVVDLGLLTATDRQIWQEVSLRSAVLVTKDRDFSLLRAASDDGPVILWIRSGNVANRILITQIVRALPEIVGAIERGEAIIEFVGRQ
jgi:predicted nuclease of predicted toxin-antitoxin system